MGACRTRSELVLAVAKNLDHVVFFPGAPPVTAQGTGDAFLACGEKSAHLIATNVAKGHVHYARCTREGCTRVDLGMDDLLSAQPVETRPVKDKAEPPIITGVIDDKLLLVWRSALGGVRMRLGRAEDLPTLNDVVLFDDLTFNRATSLHTVGMSLVARPDGAVLFLSTHQGLKAIRIGPDGSFTAMQKPDL
jgi:hypothetical protein